MSYATVQAATLAVLHKLTELDSSNCTENDWRQLAVGKAYHVVLTRGDTGNRSMQDIPANSGVYKRRSDRLVMIEIYYRYVTDLYATRSGLNALTQTILDHLDKWPNLDQTDGVVETDADNTPKPETFEAGRVTYMVQKIPFNVIELETRTVA